MWQDAGSRFEGTSLLISISFFACTSNDAGSLVCNVDLERDASAGGRTAVCN